MTLADIAEHYGECFLEQYRQQLLPGHKKALNAIHHCRTPAAGMTLFECTGCQQRDHRPMSCGHRSCNRCQNTETSEWLERQRQKLLPVEYFMVTFTLPAQLRRLDHHPHVHFVAPGGGINIQRREWCKLKGKYLFNSNNLAKVFRGRLLKALDDAGLLTQGLKKSLPKLWVVNCQHVGKGEPALKYLSRYLYRGVISDRQITAHQGGKVTFTYKSSETGKSEYRTLKGEDFLWLVLQHVLPKRFRRARDYGFLHCRAKRWLNLVQLILHVILKPLVPIIRPKYPCRFCGCDMKAIAFRFTRPT